MEQRRVLKTKLIFTFLVVFNASITCTFASDTVSTNQTIRYNETIVSPQETFELGFFRAGKSMNFYVGIWYKKIPNRTVVWVANRNTPLKHTSGELTLTLQGVLIIRDVTKGYIVCSSANSSTTSVKNPIGQLLDTGNFIIYNEGEGINQEDPIWQSFDFMTDTLLPGMKFGWNLVKGIDRNFTSWKSDTNPASGEFTYKIDTRGYPQLILTEGGVIKVRGGPWDGLRFTGISYLKPNPYYNFTFVVNQREIYYQYNLIDTSVLTRLVLVPSGRLERLLWIDNKQEWSLYNSPQRDDCDQYAVCGPFGSCNIDNSPVCSCLKGFEPVSPDQWRDTDWSQGCRHTIPLDCNPGEGFNIYSNLKLPDTRGSWYNQNMTLLECEKMCKSNCSCTAYTTLNISGTGSGCLLWFGALNDIKRFAEEGDTLYIRVSASEIDSIKNRRSSNAGRRIRVIVPVSFVALAILVSLCLFYRSYMKKQQHQGLSLLMNGTPEHEREHDPENKSDDEDLELPLLGLSTLVTATNNFSVDNKLGEGGFGPVYKGVLEDGQEIAVKRLAQTSTQGLHEFKNEVISISKLQHRNLVKLLGCCIERAEKMLIYEYMPNKGLDSFIFDRTQSKLLDWPARYRVIIGIARGLLYLHQDSRLRIIHRDLKVSNILLDTDMNPKISDFGMARSFGGNQIEANTNRVVGTYGYMAPEYAGDGTFSIKTDVYSFGVLVLEIVCGEKNRGFTHKEHGNNLIGHAWGLHKEGTSLELVAKCLGESIDAPQVLRSIHVGLLCVQRHPEDRPTMTSVIHMLGGEGPLPSPKEPGFYVGESTQRFYEGSYEASSTNELSVTTLNGR
ncbi:G-type lectin S-receptor-like serine/threonine-protein kinase At4g27290 isoform X3 [Helianthus annuus]|uniref:G-type lectin S-receptor-like serine/threonine-protein kinase At4g27290 isoform X3 n=1 Tax=Helianthus annuus TaxID=4232 RepID=UPI001652C1F0|nr:G-type lectin S-receptor-like serine/threonine-protein kinase At4g27290 isoform X3 [Helianthus annuus]